MGSLALVVACPPADDTGTGDDGEGEGIPPDPRFVVVDAGVEVDPPPPCVDDDLEDNDTTATATAIAPGDTAARFCGGDDDWYGLDVADGCAVSALVELVNDVAGEGEGEGEGEAASLADLDLVVVNLDGGALVGAGTGVGPREALNVRVPAAGRYGVRVRGGANDDTAYRLTVGVSCGTDIVCPADDVAEDNDSADSASSSLVRGVPIDGAACGNDADFYRLPVQAGCMADVQATFAHARGDIDLQMVSIADPQTVLASSASTNNVERIVRVVDPGAVVARAFLFGGADVNAGNAYRITVDEICLGDLTCPGDDPFENNDTRQSAATLGTNDEILGAACGVDDDFFSVTPQAGCTTTFTASFRNVDGDIDLQLQNASGAVIGSSLSVTDTETIAHVAQNATKVVVRVFGGVSGAQNRYRLNTRTVCP
jgi:hypothetical protein